MGIVNVTPDSFYPGSRTLARDAAIARGRELFDAGGATSSTSAGSPRVPAPRTSPRTRNALASSTSSRRWPATDRSPSTRRKRWSPEPRSVRAPPCSTTCPARSSISRGGTGRGLRGHAPTRLARPRCRTIRATTTSWPRSWSFCVTWRVARATPGCRHCGSIPALVSGRPPSTTLRSSPTWTSSWPLANEFGAGVLIGTSRKRFLGELAGGLDVDQRLEGSIATEAWALLQGVSMVRVHDAAAAVQLREAVDPPCRGGSRVRGKWAAGIEPRSFTWVYKGILAVSERPGGSTTVHRRVRRDEELLWLKHQGFGRVISILPVMQNLSAYFEHGLTASHYALRGGPQQRESSKPVISTWPIRCRTRPWCCCTATRSRTVSLGSSPVTSSGVSESPRFLSPLRTWSDCSSARSVLTGGPYSSTCPRSVRE